MRTYTLVNLEDRKRSLERSRSGGDWVALTKFIVVTIVAAAFTGFVLHHRNKVKEQSVALETAIWELECRNQELEYKLDLRLADLERLRSTDIDERARAIGLHPARSHQVVRNIPVRKTGSPLGVPTEIVRK